MLRGGGVLVMNDGEWLVGMTGRRGEEWGRRRGGDEATRWAGGHGRGRGEILHLNLISAGADRSWVKDEEVDGEWRGGSWGGWEVSTLGAGGMEKSCWKARGRKEAGGVLKGGGVKASRWAGGGRGEILCMERGGGAAAFLLI